MSYQTTFHLAKTNMRNLIIILFLSVSELGFAQTGIPDAPNPPRLVNDLTGSTLSQQELRALENKMLGYEDSTSTQVSILIVESLNGYEIADFGVRTFNEWKIGGQDVNNGILITVAMAERRMNITTGYGMEGSIPDAAAFTIIEEYMKPRFRNNDYYGGLNKATDVIFELASGEYTAEQFAQNRRRARGEGDGKGLPFGLLFILFFFIIPAIVGRRRRRAIGSRGLPWWAWLMMGSSMGSGRRDNDWDNFRGGGGMFGGGGGSGFGGGGGFGGFGGGMSGGGGASGSW